MEQRASIAELQAITMSALKTINPTGHEEPMLKLVTDWADTHGPFVWLAAPYHAPCTSTLHRIKSLRALHA